MKVLIGANPMGLERVLPPCGEGHPEVTFEHVDDRGETLIDAIADADVYVGWIGREAFVAGKKLKWIQSPSSGTNYYLEIPELVESDVLLTSARGTHVACVAESAIAMILAFTRGVIDGVKAQEKREWAGRAIRPKLVELTGSTMGVVGIGAIGRGVASRARAFGMRILAVDAFVKEKPAEVDALWPLERLSDLMAASDYVVVALPWTPETHGMIDAEAIGAMKETAMLVAMSRGGIVDEDALIEALKAKKIASAALDVFKPEPLREDSPLWDMENVLVMPHIAGGTQLEGDYIADIFRENLGKFLKGDLPLRNQVDKKLGF